MIKKAFLAILIVAAFFLSSSPVFAHPLDEIGGINVYDQKQTLEISPAKVVLKIDLTFYATEKIRVWESIDTNRDQKLTSEEKLLWMEKGMEASWIEKNSLKTHFSPDSLQISEYYEFFDIQPAKVVIIYKGSLNLAPGDQLIYYYKGKDKDLSEINFEIVGNEGILASNVQAENKGAISFSVERGSQSEIQKIDLKSSDKVNKFLDTYVKVEKVPLGLFLTAIVVSFLIGMLHALTPGHGKAIVAGYLVGEKGTVLHAIELGIIITITHTMSVFLLGLAALTLTEFIVPSTIIKWLNFASGFLVTGFGIYLLIIRFKKFRHHSMTLEETEAHELMHHPHSHGHTHMHDDQGHHHHHNSQELKLSWKNLLPLGISGGIVPCIDALAILIVAVSLGKITLGLTLLVFFSFGLAAALILGGILVVIAKSKALKKISYAAKYERYISLISAAIVFMLGLAILLGKPI